MNFHEFPWTYILVNPQSLEIFGCSIFVGINHGFQLEVYQERRRFFWHRGRGRAPPGSRVEPSYAWLTWMGSRERSPPATRLPGAGPTGIQIVYVYVYIYIAHIHIVIITYIVDRERDREREYIFMYIFIYRYTNRLNPKKDRQVISSVLF